jgi:hypothetical protein
MSLQRNARSTGLIFVGQLVVSALTPVTEGTRASLTGGPSMARYEGWILTRLSVDHRNLTASATTTVQIQSADNSNLCGAFDPVSQTKLVNAYQRKLTAGDVSGVGVGGGAWKVFVTGSTGMALTGGKLDVYAEFIRPRS